METPQKEDHNHTHTECHFMTRLHAMRERNHLTDLTISVEDQQILCHKVVLSLTSPYFNSLFEMQPKDYIFQEVQLPDNLSAEAVENVIDYLYTGKITLTQDTAMGVIDVAQHFELTDLMETCASILLDNIDCQNCLELEQMFKHKSLEKHHAEAKRFVTNNLEEILQTEGILNQEIEGLCGFLDESANKVSQRHLLEAVCRWLQYDESERLKHTARLVTYVDLLCIENAVFMTMIQVYPFIRDYVWNAHQIIDSDELLSLDKDELSRYLVESADQISQADLLEALCRWLKHDRTRLNDAFFIMPSLDLLSINKTDVQRIGASYPFIREHLWTLENVEFPMNSVKEGAQKPQGAATKPRARKQVLVAIPENEVGALQSLTKVEGFFHGNVPLEEIHLFPPCKKYNDRVWCLDLEENTWEILTRIPKERACVLSSYCVLNNMLYVCGGMERKSREITAQTVYYDIDEDQWYWGEDMLYPRHSHAATTVDGKMYVVGGILPQDKACCLCSAEIFDPNSKQWTLISDPFGPKYGLEAPCLVPIEDKLYVFGGHDIHNEADQMMRIHFYREFQGIGGSTGTLPRYLDTTTGTWHKASEECRSMLQGWMYAKRCTGESLPYRDGILFKDFSLLDPEDGQLTHIAQKPGMSIGGFVHDNGTVYCLQSTCTVPERNSFFSRTRFTDHEQQQVSNTSSCLKLNIRYNVWQELAALPVPCEKWHLVMLHKL